MLGSIFGDMAGSVYEFHNIKTTEFPLLGKGTSYTDDSVLTVAVAEWLLDGVLTGEALTACLRRYVRRFPNPMGSYGLSFKKWVRSESLQPYGSWGNGSAMRATPVGWVFESLERTLEVAAVSAAVTHNHPEGVKGAQAVAAAVFMARTGASKTEIKAFVEQRFGYDLSRTCAEIRPDYFFDESCQGTVPEALTAFLESTDFESAIRLAVSLGGDSDTLTCITGGVAEAFYREEASTKTWLKVALERLPADLAEVVERFNARFVKTKNAFCESYLHHLTNASTVLILEHNPEPVMEAFVREQLEELVDRFGEVGADVLYLPVLLQSETFGKVVEYHHPWVGPDWKELPLTAIYGAIAERFGMAASANGLLVVDSPSKALRGRFLPFASKMELMEGVEALAHQFSTLEKRWDGLQSVQEATLSYQEEQSLRRDGFRNRSVEFNALPEVDLDPELELMVRQLVETGSIRLIGKVIEKLQQATYKVSRLFITNDCRIFLKDYGMKEVVMQPLAKCLFLLYLRHEEGIRFKQLSEYEDELLSIYREISQRERPDDVAESIRAMTNPLNNSVNEKCSRIRAAFLMVITEAVAKEYFITGRKGEVKRIRLDRCLVEYQ